jgi:hypothetical protein
MTRFNRVIAHKLASALAGADERGISVRRFSSLSLVLLLIMASFTFVAYPVAASFPPPVADAGSDQTVGEGEDVTLDGSGSYDLTPDESITFSWDFDSSDGSDDVDATGETVVVSYADSGSRCCPPTLTTYRRWLPSVSPCQGCTTSPSPSTSRARASTPTTTP